MDLTTLTDQELDQLRADVHSERVRRAAIETAPGVINDALTRLLTARDGGGGTIESPTPYVTPQGYQDAYPKGFAVTDGGKIYTALRDGAVGQPSTTPADWQLYTPSGQVAEWVQPMAGGEYSLGAQVTHNGHTWTSIYNGPNGWEPTAANSTLWRDDGPV